MTTKGEKDKVKQIQDKCQAVLNALLRDEDNKYCVDCDAKGRKITYNFCFVWIKKALRCFVNGCFMFFNPD